MAELDAKREQLMKEAEEAERIVQRAMEEQKKAEIEAKEAQEKLKAQSDAIDKNASLVQSEIIDKNISAEQMEEGMAATI